MRRLLTLVALAGLGCANPGPGPSGPRGGTASPIPSPLPSASTLADFSGTWVSDAAPAEGQCVTDGYAISQAGPNLTIRTVRAKTGFSSPIPTKLAGPSATFDVEGEATTLTKVGDHLEKVVGTASPVPYRLHPDARPVPCP